MNIDPGLPLVISASLFAIVILFRARPVLFRRGGNKATITLREGRARIEAATDSESRARALCEAAEACAGKLGRTTSAVGYLQRAIRESASADVVNRAALTLAHRPYPLESLLWRRLSAYPWNGTSKEGAIAALRHLVSLYEGPLRNRSRARALEHSLRELGAEVTPKPEEP